jgi:hypothetical protein
MFAVIFMIAACGGGGAKTGGHTPSPVAAVTSSSPGAAASPTDESSPSSEASPSPEASPVVAPGPFGIVVKDFLVDGGATYTISLIRNDGGVQATVTAAKRSHPNGILVQMPSISASDSRLYYLDGAASLKYLKPDGTTGVVKTLPVDSSSAAVFAISPDDKRIAVAIITYPFPAKTRVYVEDLFGTGNHVELFSSSTVMEWPVGWHQGKLVIGVGLNAAPQNAYEGFAYNYAGYHVADAATGNRIATICADGATFGPPAAAGTTCLRSSGEIASDWAGATWAVTNGGTCGGGVLSPDGSMVAIACTDGALTIVTREGPAITTPYTATPLGWIDRLHVVQQARTGELSLLNVQLMSVTAIAASGFFAGTVPGSL